MKKKRPLLVLLIVAIVINVIICIYGVLDVKRQVERVEYFNREFHPSFIKELKAEVVPYLKWAKLSMILSFVLLSFNVAIAVILIVRERLILTDEEKRILKEDKIEKIKQKQEQKDEREAQKERREEQKLQQKILQLNAKIDKLKEKDDE